MEKDRGVLADNRLSVRQQRAPVAKKASGILGLHWDECCQHRGEVILPLHSALLRPRVEGRVQCWAPQCKRHPELLQRVQQRATKMIRRAEHLC